jgi:hypothetical protein
MAAGEKMAIETQGGIPPITGGISPDNMSALSEA